MADSILVKKKRPFDNVAYVLIYLSALISVGILVGIIIYVTIKGLSNVNWTFLTTERSALKGTTGIAGNIVNTLYIVVVTIVIATPIGVGSAIYLNEYARPGKLVKIIDNGDTCGNTFNHIRYVRSGALQSGVPPWIFAPHRSTHTDTHGASAHNKKYAGGVKDGS